MKAIFCDSGQRYSIVSTQNSINHCLKNYDAEYKAKSERGRGGGAVCVGACGRRPVVCSCAGLPASERRRGDGAFKSSQSAVRLHAAAAGASHAWRVCRATGSSRTMIQTEIRVRVDLFRLATERHNLAKINRNLEPLCRVTHALALHMYFMVL